MLKVSQSNFLQVVVRIYVSDELDYIGELLYNYVWECIYKNGLI